MEKILIIDDEVGVVEVLSEVLVHEGYDVTTTTDGNEAMEFIKTKDFNLVITDLKMPEYDGMEITKAVKERSKETDVVVITGYASLESAISALRIDVYDYILKPFNISEIIATAAKVFEKQRLKKQNQELHKQIDRALQDITTIYEIGNIINSIDNLDQILSFTSATIAESADIDLFSILLLDPLTGTFKIRDSLGLTEETVEKYSFALGDGIIGKECLTNALIRVENYENDENFQSFYADEDKNLTDCFIGIPLTTSDEPFGYLMVNRFKESDVDEDERLKLIQIVATQIAPKIQMTLLQSEINSFKDDRMSFLRYELNDILLKTSKYDETLIIMLYKFYVKRLSDVDIDINKINDHIHSVLQSEIRAIDVVYKYGLDSFIAILPGKNMFGAESFGKKVKEEVEKNIKFHEGMVLLLDYGYSLYPSDSTKLDELLAKAQNKLWKMVKK